MFKTKYGPITNLETKKAKDIVVNVLSMDNAKDFLIGGGIVMIGLCYIAISEFKNGSKAFEMAELATLEALDLVK